MRIALLLGLAVAAATVTGTAHADGMRCGSRLIRDGNARAEVRAFCGEPADVQTRTILRRSDLTLSAADSLLQAKG